MNASIAVREEFTAQQVRALTGVPYETLNFWARIGLVQPSVLAARGPGSIRLYDFQDVVAIRVALKLRKSGVFGPSLVRILPVLRQAGFDSPAKVSLQVSPAGDVEILGARQRARQRPDHILLDFSCDCTSEVKALRRLVASSSAELDKPIRRPSHNQVR